MLKQSKAMSDNGMNKPTYISQKQMIILFLCFVLNLFLLSFAFNMLVGYGVCSFDQCVFTFIGGCAFQGDVANCVMQAVKEPLFISVVFASIGSLFVLLMLNFVRHYRVSSFFVRLSVLYLCISPFWFAFYVIDRVKLPQWSHDSSFVEENASKPAMSDFSFPAKKRNLVFIYLESIELSFLGDASGIPGTNYMPELCELLKEGECFSAKGRSTGVTPLSATGWTQASMFGSNTGYPLKMYSNSNLDHNLDAYYPTMISVSDILYANGYQNRVRFGSVASFARRDAYFEQHGSFDVRDYAYSVNSGEQDISNYDFWGYDDHTLFEYAKQDALDLSKSGQPFCLVLETVDTHFPDGYTCPYCGHEYADEYGNILRCNSRHIYDYVRWLQEQPFYEDTTIILMGDHTTMADFGDLDESPYQRKTYFCIINGVSERETDDQRVYSAFDVAPTTLAAIGVDMKSDRFGLGTNLYSKKKTLFEQYGVEYMENGLCYSSPLMRRWFYGEP